MALYEHTMNEIVKGKKNNLIEKMSGSHKYEFKKICGQLEKTYHIKPNNLLGLGTSCIVYDHGESVIKVCAKKIKYFHNRKSRSATDFQNTVKPLAPYLLSVDAIIYDGDDFFAYIQGKCKPLPKKKAIRSHDLSDILKVVQVMLSNGILIGQIKPKNVGHWHGHVVLFDYHSMHQLYDRMKDKRDWYHSLTEALSLYNSLHKHNRSTDLSELIEQIKRARNSHDIHAMIESIEKIRKHL